MSTLCPTPLAARTSYGRRAADNRVRSLTIPAQDYPAGFVFYKMSKAGLLCGLPESVDLSSMWQMVVVRLIPLSQVDQYLGLAGRTRNGAGFEFFGRS